MSSTISTKTRATCGSAACTSAASCGSDAAQTLLDGYPRPEEPRVAAPGVHVTRPEPRGRRERHQRGAALPADRDLHAALLTRRQPQAVVPGPGAQSHDVL